MTKTALVTGGSQGIGRAIAAGLSAAGCDVMLVARRQNLLEAAAQDIAAATGQGVLTIEADLSTPAGVAHAAARAQAIFPTLDVLVNNAGSTVRGSLLSVSDDDWTSGFALKFHGAARLTRALWPLLSKAGGAVLNIAGVAGRTPTADFVVGSAVNAAIMAFTKSMAEQGAKDGVRVNCINPGLIKTARLQRRVDDIMRRDGLDQAKAEAALAREWGVQRIGRPEEIAALAVFLTVGEGTYCQGGIYDVDGGRTRGL
jgi:3-oxoacyl-[acyl-carrier protein] reductase